MYPQQDPGNQQPYQGTGYQYNQNNYQQAPQAQPAPQFPQQPQFAPQQNDRVALSQPVYGINPIEAFKRFLKKYATFSGRASRSEYWWTVLCLAVIQFVVMIVAGIASSNDSVSFVGAILLLLLGLWELACIVPTWSLTVRRYHDSNHSGWLFLVSQLLQVAAVIVLLVGVISAFGSLIGMVSYFSDGGGYGYDYSFDSDTFTASTVAYGDYSDPDAVFAMFITKFLGWYLFAALLSLGGGIMNFVFTLLGSKPEGYRFDSPQLPIQYTTFSPDTAYTYVPAPQAQAQAQAQQPYQQPAPSAYNTFGSPEPSQPQSQTQGQTQTPQGGAAAPSATNPYTTPMPQYGAEPTIPLAAGTPTDNEEDHEQDPSPSSDSGYQQN